MAKNLDGIENPAEAFLKPAAAGGSSAPTRRTRKERKSVRRHISLYPSTVERLEALAESCNTSVNDLINDLLKEALDREGA